MAFLLVRQNMVQNNFELDTHAFDRILPEDALSRCEDRAMVELVDIYPTLVEWAGLPSLPT